MLTIVGDILNWLAAGVVFPCIFLPLAALFADARRSSTGVWLALIASAVIAGALFAALAPTLRAAPSLAQSLTFAAFAAGLAVIIFTAGGAGALIKRLSPPIETIVKGTGRTVMWLLLLMAFVQFGVVVLRYVFGVNFIFMQESITYMHGAVFLLAAGYALITDDHVRVDIFYRDAPANRKALIDFVGTYLLLFPVCLLLLWTASPYVANSWAVGEGSTEASGIQGVYLMKSLIPAFAALLAMAGFVIAGRAGETLRKGNQRSAA